MKIGYLPSGVGCQVSGVRCQEDERKSWHLNTDTWIAWAKSPTILIYTHVDIVILSALWYNYSINLAIAEKAKIMAVLLLDDWLDNFLWGNCWGHCSKPSKIFLQIVSWKFRETIWRMLVVIQPKFTKASMAFVFCLINLRERGSPAADKSLTFHLSMRGQAVVQKR